MVLKVDIIINRLLRAWLIGVLVYILFQFRIVQILTSLNINLATFFNRIDEFTIIVFLPLAFIKYVKNTIRDRLYVVLFIPIAGLVITGLLSGAINDNPLKITLLGTFSYIKFFFLIFIYAAFFKDEKDFKRLYKIFLIIAIGLIFVALVQEIWALCSRYILNKDITDPRAYLIGYLSNTFGVSNIEEIGNWRWHIYRTPSLLSHYNLFGMFCLFVLSIYLFCRDKESRLLVFLLICGVVLSVSRIAYIGLLFVLFVRIFNKKGWYISLSIMFVLLTLILSLRTENKISESEMQKQGSYLVRQNKISFRQYAEFMAMQVWRDYPLFGAGPGMFGGDVAYKYNSPLYEEYNFYEIYRHIRSLDQFWPQLLAEMGVVGGTTFIIFIITVFGLLLTKEYDSLPQKGFARALGVFTVIFLFYTFSGNLNNPALLYPYCVFLGIGLGSSKK